MGQFWESMHFHLMPIQNAEKATVQTGQHKTLNTCPAAIINLILSTCLRILRTNLAAFGEPDKIVVSKSIPENLCLLRLNKAFIKWFTALTEHLDGV